MMDSCVHTTYKTNTIKNMRNVSFTRKIAIVEIYTESNLQAELPLDADLVDRLIAQCGAIHYVLSDTPSENWKKCFREAFDRKLLAEDEYYEAFQDAMTKDYSELDKKGVDKKKALESFKWRQLDVATEHWQIITVRQPNEDIGGYERYSNYLKLSKTMQVEPVDPHQFAEDEMSYRRIVQINNEIKECVEDANRDCGLQQYQ
jgi:hypothetical protein